MLLSLHVLGNCNVISSAQFVFLYDYKEVTSKLTAMAAGEMNFFMKKAPKGTARSMVDLVWKSVIEKAQLDW